MILWLLTLTAWSCRRSELLHEHSKIGKPKRNLSTSYELDSEGIQDLRLKSAAIYQNWIAHASSREQTRTPIFLQFSTSKISTKNGVKARIALNVEDLARSDPQHKITSSGIPSLENAAPHICKSANGSNIAAVDR